MTITPHIFTLTAGNKWLISLATGSLQPRGEKLPAPTGNRARLVPEPIRAYGKKPSSYPCREVNHDRPVRSQSLYDSAGPDPVTDSKCTQITEELIYSLKLKPYSGGKKKVYHRRAKINKTNEVKTITINKHQLRTGRETKWVPNVIIKQSACAGNRNAVVQPVSGHFID